MIAEIINLRRVKKSATRAAEEKTAAANRQKFGRSKTEKALLEFENSRNKLAFDGKKLQD